MLLRKLVVVGLAGIINFAAQVAMAQEAAAPAPQFVALERANFSDSSPGADTLVDRLSLDIGAAPESRFADFAPAPWRERDRDAAGRGYEVALAARGVSGFDISAAQRGRFGFDASGDVARESRSSELRLGRGLSGLREDADPAAPAWYMFVASEDEALIWRPGGQHSAFGGTSPGFALQDRVEIGDIQAGVTYEAYGIQASLAYVERTVSVNVGRDSFSTEERFAGVTVTLRN